MLYLTIFLSFYLLNINLFSNNEDFNEKFSFSVSSSLIFSNNITNFKQLSQIENCCPETFTNSTSTNNNLEIGYRQFLNKKHAIFFTLGAVNYNDKFSNFEQKITKDGLSTIKHNIELNMFNLQNKIGLSNKINNLNLSYGIINELILIKNFNQSENLIIPQGATFENNLRTRNTLQNQKAEYINNINFGIFAQIWYQIYLNNTKTKSIAPYFEFNYIFSDYHQFGQFKKLNYQIGLQYRFIKIKGLDTPLSPSK